MSQLPEHIQALASGSFRGRVGHKAGGFIAKKKFHPSNFDNQEKLWLAREEQRKLKVQQEEFSRKRDEERKIEALREEIFQTTGVTQGQVEEISMTPEQRKAAEETKRRLEAVRANKEKSGVLEFGHSNVWGSWFEDGQWGYACCRGLERGQPCNKRKRES